MFAKFVTKKTLRLVNSTKVLRILFYYHKIFKDKRLGNIGFDFSKKKTRLTIIQEIIEKKNMKNTLKLDVLMTSFLTL